MTLMPSGMQLLKSDSVGWVQTPAEKRAEIPREFDRSGASGVEFAKHIGAKHPTFSSISTTQTAFPHQPRCPICRREHPAGLVASMSGRDNCDDNASMESFWSTLKLELVYRGKLTGRTHTRSEIVNLIEVFYNHQRRHTSLGGISPSKSELKNN